MELQQFGWNAVTVGFLGTVLFTVVSAWSLWRQYRRIVARRSGRSVPVMTYTFRTVAFVAVLIYGLHIGSLALIFNGSLVVLIQLPILVALWRYRGFTRRERLACLGFLVLLTVMCLFPLKDWFLLAFALGTLGFNALMPYEIWRNRDAGSVEIRVLLVGLAGNSFWLTYACAIGDWVLMTVNPAFLTLSLLTTILWFRYRPRPVAT
ncbi:hypothetical protein AMJ57_01615 [Parcubacteria bacterium SG8_24]|nr:MAG: hypothetical protein AMJ57_01615 [Parcubacteria bacterium SG8_24]